MTDYTKVYMIICLTIDNKINKNGINWKNIE